MEMEPPPLDALLESEKGGAAPLATSVVAHTDQAGELEAYGFPATNALRHNGLAYLTLPSEGAFGRCQRRCNLV